MTAKRESQRLVRRLLRVTKLSPENFAKAYPHYTNAASARTIRRWDDGESVPSPLVMRELAQLATTLEAK